MRRLFIATLLLGLAIQSVAAPNGAQQLDIDAVKGIVNWVLTLHTFRGAIEKDQILGPSEPPTTAVAVSTLTSKDGDVAIGAASWDGTVVITLYSRAWSDANAALLRTLEKHFTAGRAEPELITPDAALQTRLKPIGIYHNLAVGKTSFGWAQDIQGIQACPWKGGCYLAEIRPLQP